MLALLLLSMLAPPVRGASDHDSVDAGTAREGSHLSKEVIGKVVRSYWPGIKECYEAALNKDPELSLGKIVVRFAIEPSGTVSSAEIPESTTGAPEIGACIVPKVLKWRFPEFKGTQKQVVAYPWIFRGTSETEPPDGSLKPEPQRGEVSFSSGVEPQGLSLEAASEVIKKHLGEIKACYDGVLAQEPCLTGRIPVDFWIDGSGSVSKVSLGKRTLHHHGLETCVVQVMRRWKFPRPSDGRTTKVVNRWNFVPGVGVCPGR